MNNEITKQLKDEIADIMLKYKDKLSAGEINNSIINMAFSMACALTVRLNPDKIEAAIEDVKKDHLRFIIENADSIRKYYNV